METARTNNKQNTEQPMSTKKKGSNKVRTTEIELDKMDFWRNLAKAVCPELTDDMEIGECAIMLQELSKHVSTEQKRISSICNLNEDTKISVSFGVTLDRRVVPTEVTTKISYGPKYRKTIKAAVPDPNQQELPMADTEQVSQGQSSLPPSDRNEAEE